MPKAYKISCKWQFFAKSGHTGAVNVVDVVWKTNRRNKIAVDGDGDCDLEQHPGEPMTAPGRNLVNKKTVAATTRLVVTLTSCSILYDLSLSISLSLSLTLSVSWIKRGKKIKIVNGKRNLELLKASRWCILV